MNSNTLRIIGNYGLIANTIFGQFVNLRIGLCIGIFLSLTTLPYYVKHRLWDIVAFIAFINAVNLASAISGIPGCHNI
jgi:hypothetical protein